MTSIDTMSMIGQLRSWTGDQGALRKIAKSLHSLDECACNYGLTERQEKRKAKLGAEADRIGAFFGLKAYHQSDPRGGTLYMVPID